MDAAWRLETYSKILSLTAANDVGITLGMDILNELLPNHLKLVIECFTKLLKGLTKDDYIYIQTEKAKPILKAGLMCENETTRKLAEDARELLLRAGRFDFLEN